MIIKILKDLSKIINVKSSPQLSDGLSTILKDEKLIYQNFNWIDVGKFHNIRIMLLIVEVTILVKKMKQFT